MPLTPLATDLWGVEHDHFMGPLHFRGRMTVARIDGGLWLHSPVPIDDALAAALHALGPVRWLVAPNGFHHTYLSAAAARWPDAQVWVSPGLLGKRPDLADAHRLDALPTGAWPGLQALRIRGVPKFDEFVFFHAPTGSLIVTDLVTCIRVANTWLSRLFFRLEGIWDRPAHSPLWRWLTKDRAAFAASLSQVLRWPIQRVVVAHGEVIEVDTVATLRRLWAKPLAAGRPAGPVIEGV